jgi:hypothetical protein
VVVYDEFECVREHDLELNFQFAPGELHAFPCGVLVYEEKAAEDSASSGTPDRHVRFAWTGTMDLKPTLKCAGLQPDEGWIAPSLGIRAPAPRLTLVGRIGPGSAVMSVIAATQADERFSVEVVAPVRVERMKGAIHVTGRGFDDYISAPGDRTPRALEDRVVISRFRDGHLAETFRLGETDLR